MEEQSTTAEGVDMDIPSKDKKMMIKSKLCQESESFSCCDIFLRSAL